MYNKERSLFSLPQRQSTAEFPSPLLVKRRWFKIYAKPWFNTASCWLQACFSESFCSFFYFFWKKQHLLHERLMICYFRHSKHYLWSKADDQRAKPLYPGVWLLVRLLRLDVRLASYVQSLSQHVCPCWKWGPPVTRASLSDIFCWGSVHT